MAKYLPDFTALALLYALVFFRRWRQNGTLAVHTLMYLYLCGVLFFTLMPLLPYVPFLFNHPYRFMNLVPFVDVLTGRGDFVRQVALNVIMTIPFGFLFPLTRRGEAGFLKTVLCCALMSLGIELLQPLLHGTRSGDITDLITNTVGGAIGYGLWAVFRGVTGIFSGRDTQ